MVNYDRSIREPWQQDSLNEYMEHLEITLDQLRAYNSIILHLNVGLTFD